MASRVNFILRAAAATILHRPHAGRQPDKPLGHFLLAGALKYYRRHLDGMSEGPPSCAAAPSTKALDLLFFYRPGDDERLFRMPTLVANYEGYRFYRTWLRGR
jgi:hypothetical protein